MSTDFALIRALAWCLLLALADAAGAQPSRPDEPLSEQQGSPADREGERDVARAGPRRDTPVWPPGPNGDLIRRHFARMVAVGTDPRQNYEDAERAYQASLGQLRERAAQIAPALSSAYARAPETEYFFRWAIVETLRELRSERAQGDLVRIAASAIPPERFGPGAERSSVGEEIRIRATAIEAVAQWAAAGSAAERLLLDLARNEQLGIRRAAIRGYLHAARTPEEREQRADRLRAQLPATSHPLVTLDITDIRTVPHPDMPGSNETKPSARPADPPPKARPRN